MWQHLMVVTNLKLPPWPHSVENITCTTQISEDWQMNNNCYECFCSAEGNKNNAQEKFTVLSSKIIILKNLSSVNSMLNASNDICANSASVTEVNVDEESNFQGLFTQDNYIRQFSTMFSVDVDGNVCQLWVKTDANTGAHHTQQNSCNLLQLW